MKTISQVRKPVNKRNRIKILFEESGLSLREIAKYSEVSIATLSRVSLGKPPEINTAFKLAKFFETSVEDLFSEFIK